MVSQVTRNRIEGQVGRLTDGGPCRLQVAALPWRHGPDGLEILLITSRDSGRWVLPKGWPEGREQLYDTAAREAAEEAGLNGAVAQQQIGHYFYDKGSASRSERRCEVMVFPLEVEALASRWPERKERTRQWFPAMEAATLVRESDLADLIRRFAADPRPSL